LPLRRAQPTRRRLRPPWLPPVRPLQRSSILPRHPLEKVLGDVTTPGQTSQKREQAAIELGVYDVECVCFAGAEASDERELGFAVHGDLLYRSHVEGFSPGWREASPPISSDTTDPRHQNKRAL